MKIRSIAFYLPQYHPIPENDSWWGRGFTEWTNVTAARARFPGHYQPHLPADLGYYDLRLAEARAAQADLARRYGISGFCYYHYWFHGKRLLQRPFDEVLRSGAPDFPFCLCWANENWTRSWNGRDKDVLLWQTYSPEDDLQHIRELASAFQDRRYIRLEGRPILLVYRVSNLPDPAATATRWRQECRALGIGEIALLSVESSPACQRDPREIGFDYAVEFQPDWSRLPPPLRRGRRWRQLTRLGLSSSSFQHDRVMAYEAMVAAMRQKPIPPYPRFPCVTPAWDNSARRETHATILQGSTPDLYGAWLGHEVQRLPERALPEPWLFINAWNEWAEGNHLEPDQRWGLAYLAKTKEMLLNSLA
ncbi:MAG: glycoside hydrolase family 99-like domain-containing protein [Cyanobacteria bacterium J06638_7]